jgi:hypothetical protein
MSHIYTHKISALSLTMSTHCLTQCSKSVLSRHPVYTMHMRGAAAQGWSAKGLTVTQWIIGHNSSGSEAEAWFSLSLLSRLSTGPVQLDSRGNAVTRWHRLSYPGLTRDETYCCYACLVGHALYERRKTRLVSAPMLAAAKICIRI